MLHLEKKRIRNWTALFISWTQIWKKGLADFEKFWRTR
jgi:hypothetical protein